MMKRGRTNFRWFPESLNDYLYWKCLQISSISNASRSKMRFKNLGFSKSRFLKRVLLMTSQSHDHVVKIIFYDMNLKAPTIIYKTCARNKLYLLYFSHSYTTKRRRKTQKMSSIVYISLYIYSRKALRALVPKPI